MSWKFLAYWLLRRKEICTGADDTGCPNPRKRGRRCFACWDTAMRADLRTPEGKALLRAIELDQAAQAGRPTPMWGSEPCDVEAAYKVWAAEKGRYEREAMKK